MKNLVRQGALGAVDALIWARDNRDQLAVDALLVLFLLVTSFGDAIVELF
jgi:hypothetical protein